MPPRFQVRLNLLVGAKGNHAQSAHLGFTVLCPSVAGAAVAAVIVALPGSSFQALLVVLLVAGEVGIGGGLPVVSPGGFTPDVCIRLKIALK